MNSLQLITKEHSQRSTTLISSVRRSENRLLGNETRLKKKTKRLMELQLRQGTAPTHLRERTSLIILELRVDSMLASEPSTTSEHSKRTYNLTTTQNGTCTVSPTTPRTSSPLSRGKVLGHRWREIEREMNSMMPNN